MSTSLFKNKKGFTPHLLRGQKKYTYLTPKKGAGFTLVELLVVVSIIGILASLSTVSVNIARQRARDAKRKADVAQVQLALYMYFDDNLHFPIVSMLPEDAINNWNTVLTRSLNGTETGKLYMGRVATDPINVYPYIYGYNSDGKEFIITYYLENEGPVEEVMQQLYGY